MSNDNGARLAEPGSIHDVSEELATLAQAQSDLRRSMRFLTFMLLVVAMLAVVSLGINFLLVTRLLRMRGDVLALVDSASHSLDNLAGQGLAFDVPISQTLHFEGDVPIKQDLNLPFRASIPFNTTVSVPIDLGPLGSHTVNIPVSTTIPVDVVIPVHVEQTVHVSTELPVRTVFPIRLSGNDPPLNDWVAQVREWLKLVRQYF